MGEKRKIKWGEAICMVICAFLMIVLFRMLGFGRILGSAVGGAVGALLGMGVYFLLTSLFSPKGKTV